MRLGRGSPGALGRGGWRAVVGAALAAALGSLPGSATAQDAAPPAQDETVAQDLHPDAREAISKIRSPFCPGLMLEVCPTREAQALRDSIQAGAEAGVDADGLVERVVALHGEEYRAFPKPSGAGLLAWLMPPLALVAGLAVVVVALRRLLAPGTREAGAGLSDEERGRIEAALEAFDASEEDRT